MADPRLQKLAEENRRLAAELAEAREVLRALRSGEADALVSTGNDAVFGVQLIALAVGRADTYYDSLTLLLEQLCRSTGWQYGEAWTVSGEGLGLRRTPAWYCADAALEGLHDELERVARNAHLLAGVARDGEPRWFHGADLEDEAIAPAVRRYGLKSGAALPVVVSGEPVAIVWLWRRDDAADVDPDLRQERRILEEAAPFVQSKSADDRRRRAVESLKGTVHERSRMLAELSGMVEQQSQRSERFETLSRAYQESSARSERTREQQGALLVYIMSAIADGVVVTDRTGHVLQFNPAARRLLGAPAVDVPWAQWPETFGLHHPGTRDRLAPEDFPLVKAAQGAACDQVEIFVRNSLQPAGRRIAMSARPLVDQDNVPYGAVAVFHDLT